MNKRNVFDKAWEESPQFFVVVSTEHGAKLPSHLTGHVHLHFGRGLAIPVRPVFTDEGLNVELSFDRAPFDCEIPWHSVVAMLTDFWQIAWHMGDPVVAPKPKLRAV